jgi:hypothetical protein
MDCHDCSCIGYFSLIIILFSLSKLCGRSILSACLLVFADAKSSAHHLNRVMIPTIMRQAFLRLTHLPCLTCVSRHRPRLAVALVARKYATHRDQLPSSLLTNVLDQKAGSTQREDSVGPFQLGLGQPSFGKDEKVRKWSELSTGGKGAQCITDPINFYRAESVNSA